MFVQDAGGHYGGSDSRNQQKDAYYPSTCASPGKQKHVGVLIGGYAAGYTDSSLVINNPRLLLVRISASIQVGTSRRRSPIAAVNHMLRLQTRAAKRENCKEAFYTWSSMGCSIWSRLLGNIDFKALSSSLYIYIYVMVHTVFCWITAIPLPSYLPSSAERSVARSYYAPITFLSLHNPRWHNGKLFMICNYVFQIR